MDSLTTMNSDLHGLLQLSRAQTNQFSRSKLPQLLPEYKELLRLIQTEPHIEEGTLLQHDLVATTFTNQKVLIPKFAKLMSKLPDHEKGRDGSGNFIWNRCTWGIQWSEFEFIEAATKAGHPRSGTIIFEAELLAVWIAMKAWKHKLAGSMVIFYVDNDSVRGAYAASTTRSGFVGKLIENLNILEEEFCINIWIARVPTKCNIADPPSRFDCSIFEKLSAKRIQLDIDIESLRGNGGDSG